MKNGLYSDSLMTICLAVISDMNTTSPKIVFAADRLITMVTNFESGVSKISMLMNNSYVAVSSNQGLMSDLIIRKVQERIKKSIESKKPPTINQISDWFSIECKNRLKSEIEDAVLFRYDLSYDEFKDQSKNLHEDVVQDIIDKFDRYESNFSTSFLLVGIENSKPYIFTIDQNGYVNLWNSVGFATIGEGAFLAHNEITKYPYNPNMPLKDTVPLVYYSKKASERTSGIGENTDLAILYIVQEKNVETIWVIDDEIKSAFDTEIGEMKKAEKESYKKMSEKFETILKSRENMSEKTN